MIGDPFAVPTVDEPPPLDLSSLTATPVDFNDHMTPNHFASGDPIEEPKPKPRTVRERLMDAAKPKTVHNEPRNVKAPRPKKVVPNKPGQFVGPLTDFYNTAGLLAMPFKPSVGMTLLGPCRQPTDEDPNPPTVAENCARAWDEAAQRSESLRRTLDGLLTAGVWGAVVAAHMPIAMAFMGDSPKVAQMMNQFTRQQDEQVQE